MTLQRHQSSRRRSLGQSTGEYVGIVAVVAILAAALIGFAPSLAAEPVKSVGRAVDRICEAAGFGCTPEAAPKAAGDQTAALTPEQRATQGKYVALGDSFSSGEGGSAYDPETDESYAGQSKSYYDTHDKDGNPTAQVCASRGGPTYCAPDPRIPQSKPYHNTCHRSTGAYPTIVNSEYTFAGGFDFKACSGAVTSDFTGPNGNGDGDDDSTEKSQNNDNEPAQLDHLDEKTSLVTFTIGGNDAKFADTLTDCILAGMNPFDKCTDSDEVADVEANIDTALENLEELLPKVAAKAPNARILVLGYPRFFPEDPGSSWSDGTQIDTDDITFIHSKVKDMDQRIKTLVDDLNKKYPGQFEYVDVYDAFNGCEIGTDNPCMNNIETRWADGKLDKNGSYHPNDEGHKKMADIVKKKIKNG